MNLWYVLQVESGKEISVRDSLKNSGFPALVPRQTVKERSGGKWRDKEKILIPGYVFLRLAAKLDANTYYKAKAVSGVIHFCGAGREPIPIEPEEANYILALAPNDDPLGLSEIFVEGDTVNVVSGALLGLSGRIVSVDKRRFKAKVELSFFGGKKTVEMAVSILDKPE